MSVTFQLYVRFSKLITYHVKRPVSLSERNGVCTCGNSVVDILQNVLEVPIDRNVLYAYLRLVLGSNEPVEVNGMLSIIK